MPRTLQEIAKEINDWQDRIFIHATPLSAAKHLQREIRELIFDIENGNPKTAESEVADCFILLLAVTYLLGIDLEQATDEKMAINFKRSWGEPDADGVVEHVRVLENKESEGAGSVTVYDVDGRCLGSVPMYHIK